MAYFYDLHPGVDAAKCRASTIVCTLYIIPGAAVTKLPPLPVIFCQVRVSNI